MYFFWMTRWCVRVFSESRTARRLLGLTGCSSILFTLGAVMDCFKAPLLLMCLLFVVTFVYCWIFAVIRQMWRNVRAGRHFNQDDEDDEEYGFLMHNLLAGLAFTSVFLTFGYAMIPGKMFHVRTDERVLNVLIFTMHGCLYLFGAYVCIISPVFFLLKFLPRRWKRKLGIVFLASLGVLIVSVWTYLLVLTCICIFLGSSLLLSGGKDDEEADGPI